MEYTDGLNGHRELTGWLTGRGREENTLMEILYLKITLRDMGQTTDLFLSRVNIIAIYFFTHTDR